MSCPYPRKPKLLKGLLLSLLLLCLLPATTYLFAGRVQRAHDQEFLEAVMQHIETDRELSAEDREAARTFYGAHPPSVACRLSDPELQDYRNAVCEPSSAVWQFALARRIALWTMLAGGSFLAVLMLLGLLAFVNDSLRYASFVTGWRLSTWVIAGMVMVQGVMAVWLSFWVTAHFFQLYSLQLIGVAGIFAVLGVFVAIKGIFTRVRNPNAVDGELLKEADAPRLWQRIRALAQRLDTAPPQQIVAGIDSNFFVTEARLTVADTPLNGRTLFISIPLLRILDQNEADAVFAHELAHLSGGDTRSSALLGPKLVQFDHYTEAILEGGLTMLLAPLLLWYRVIFEVALSRHSRQREFRADRCAADLVAPAAMGQSLVKITAYAQYREEVEAELFHRDQRLDETLGLARFIADGLRSYVQTEKFNQAMVSANVPHPFDSHPPLPERLANVGAQLPEHSFSALVASPPGRTWVEEILTADAIEGRLWADYESKFAADHEAELACRYEPANDEELAIVLKYFPPVEIALKRNRTIEISHLGIKTSADQRLIDWDAVEAVTFQESWLGHSLVVTHPKKGRLLAKTSKIKLAGIKKQQNRLKEEINRYWQRHQFMRANQVTQENP
jgi:Zn-dependent protease with chaperone function